MPSTDPTGTNGALYELAADGTEFIGHNLGALLHVFDVTWSPATSRWYVCGSRRVTTTTGRAVVLAAASLTGPWTIIYESTEASTYARAYWLLPTPTVGTTTNGPLTWNGSAFVADPTIGLDGSASRPSAFAAGRIIACTGTEIMGEAGIIYTPDPNDLTAFDAYPGGAGYGLTVADDVAWFARTAVGDLNTLWLVRLSDVAGELVEDRWTITGLPPDVRPSTVAVDTATGTVYLGCTDSCIYRATV